MSKNWENWWKLIEIAIRAEKISTTSERTEELRKNTFWENWENIFLWKPHGYQIDQPPHPPPSFRFRGYKLV